MNKNAPDIIVEDWNPIENLKYDEKIFCYKNVDAIDSENLGIYLDNRNRYHSSGYVGVCVLRGKDGQDYYDDKGNRKILCVRPRFNTLSPWQMLAEIMQDEEYEDYIQGSENTIYSIFEDEPPVELDVAESGGEILLALSFIRCCYRICTVNLKRQMAYVSENLNGKVRGRIDFSNHVKKNVAKGRMDRVYCKYPVFSEDILENRVLKAALALSKKLLRINKCLDADGMESVRSMSSYCDNRLKNISYCQITKSDFSAINVKGFNSAYAPAIRLARMLLLHSNMSIDKDGRKSGFVVPYAIRMEALFEFYTRTRIKKYLKNTLLHEQVRLDHYRSNRGNEKPLFTIDSDNMYLMNTYIPDIAFQVNVSDKDADIKTWKYVAVMDVKYQRSTDKVGDETRRRNSHQLLFYTLLLNVKRCGFIFPEEKNAVYGKLQYQEGNLILQDGNAESSERSYHEFHFGEDEASQESEIKRLVAYALKGEKILEKDQNEEI